MVQNNGFLGERRLNCGSNRFFRNLQQLFSKPYELVDRQRAMPFVGGGLKREGDTGPKPLWRFFCKTEPHRDCIGAAEANAADVASEAVRVFSHDGDRIMAVGLENAHRTRCADAVAV